MPVELEPALVALNHEVIGAAMRVHSALGPGFLEAIYEEAMCIELKARHIAFERQVSITTKYRGFIVGAARLDLVVEERTIVELKAIESLSTLQVAQVVAYLRASKLTVGLLINFNVPHLRAGIRRIINTS